MPNRTEPQRPEHQRKCFHRSHAHLLTALTPLVIGELVHDPDKRWRWIRIGSIVIALIGEVEQSWHERVMREREAKESEGQEDRPVQGAAPALSRLTLPKVGARLTVKR